MEAGKSVFKDVFNAFWQFLAERLCIINVQIDAKIKIVPGDHSG
jgi:hypothetical protein